MKPTKNILIVLLLLSNAVLIGIIFQESEKVDSNEFTQPNIHPFNPNLNVTAESLIEDGFSRGESEPQLIKNAGDAQLYYFIHTDSSDFSYADPSNQLYSGTFVKKINSAELPELEKIISFYDADIISRLDSMSDGSIVFFAKHRYNNIISRCFVNKENDMYYFKVPLINAITDPVLVNERKQRLQSKYDLVNH